MIIVKDQTIRFCENRVMSEYNTKKPFFINNADDLDPCSYSAGPSEDVFKKFQLYLTPPGSPHRDDPTPELVPATTDQTFTSGLDSCNEFGYNFDCPKYSDVITTTFEYVKSKFPLCECKRRRLIKDCMWNGVGHKASSALRKAHNLTGSAIPPFPCHPNGCVDPRNIFPYPVGQPAPSEEKGTTPNSTNTAQKAHRPMVDGAETPSDSEEEIDVVTVEKTQNNTILKPKNRLNASQKIIATIVPKPNGKVAIVTASGASIGPNSLIKTIARNSEAERGRPKNKFHVFTAAPSPTITSGRSPRVVAMATGNGNLNEQQVALTGLKRRRTAEERCCIASKESLMQIANPKHVMQRGDSVSPVPKKRRMFSLDVSFCGSTGLRRYEDEPSLAKPVAQNVDILKTAQEMTIGKFKINKIQSPTIAETIEIKQELVDDVAGFRSQGSKSPQNKRKRKAEALASLLAAGSGSDGEQIRADGEQIRAAHNVLERQRREGLRTSFHTLRDNVPELRKMEKTPKVNILNKARDHCLELQATERTLMAEKERMSKRNQRLQERLESAKKSLMSIRPQDSDIESDVEESEDSPLSSLPTSLPPSPQVYAPSGYYIARRVASDNTNSPQEVMLRLESPPSKINAKGYPDYSVKPAKGPEIRAFIASLQKTPEVTNSRDMLSGHQDVFSDGFECLDSDEDIFEALY